MDATRDIVDTSDTEERELLNAEAPGYYQRVWGSTSHAGLESSGRNDVSAFPRVEPQTPSRTRIPLTNTNDPSSAFSRLQISPAKLEGNAPIPVTPATTPADITSNYEPGILVSELTAPIVPLPWSRSTMRSQSQDSLALLSPLTPPPPSPVAETSAAPSSSVVLPHLSPPVPAYSLRVRSAIQLNPFEYEKRMYKRQLRRVPEAIVKNPVVAGRKEYRQEDEWEDRSEEEGRSNDELQREERNREKNRQNQIVDERMRELGITIPSEDEDDGVPWGLEAEENPTLANEAEKRGKKRKRRARVHEFPMNVATETPSSHLSRSGVASGISSRSRPRPRPAFRGQSPTTSPPRPMHVSHATASPSPADIPQYPDVDLDNPSLGSDSPIRIADTSRGSSPVVIEDLHAIPEPVRSSLIEHESLDHDIQLHEDGNNDTSSNAEHSDDSTSESSEVELTERDRKRLKVMRRMMPAALVRKLLAEEQGKPKQKRSKAYQPEDSEESEGTASRQPGRGRKRIVSPGAKDPKRYEIRGDPDSETDSGEENLPLAVDEVIELENSDDDGSNSIGLPMEKNEIGADDVDIQTWLEPDTEYNPVQDKIHSSAHKVHRSDHDRDLPREGDIIDRMLQRTNCTVPRNSGHTKRHKGHTTSKSNGRPVLDIVTREARAHRGKGGRQTKLPFSTISNPRKNAYSGTKSKSVPQHPPQRINSTVGVVKRRTKKQRKFGEAGLWINHADGHQVTSGRRRQFMSIAHDDDTFHEALTPENHVVRERTNHDREGQKNARNIINKFRAAANCGEERDAFDQYPNRSFTHSHVTLDFDIPLLPSGMTLGIESYMGKGTLVQLISVLSGEKEAPCPLAITAFGQEMEPSMPASQFSASLAAACDGLYDTSIATMDDPEMPLKLKAAEATMQTLCEFVSYRAWREDDDSGEIATGVSEQTAHLVGRINGRLEQLSADGYVLDSRCFALYWFVMELELRSVFAHRKRKAAENDQGLASTAVAERYAVLFLQRLMEYGLDRTMQPLQQLETLNITLPDVRTIELWACFFYIAPFFGMAEEAMATDSRLFWRILEMAMEQQSNIPDSSLDRSERLWRTIFSLCSISQFSVHGLTTSTVRLEQNWPMVSKALGHIRLGADERLDHDKPASTLKKRDKYLRLVTMRCLLLSARYHWPLHDAETVLRDLCAIFRSRKFSNLLGETSDFPTFIRDRDEPLFYTFTEKDTAYGVFLKMIIRALKDFPDVDRAARTRKLSKLLGAAVPVGSLSFTKSSPPIGQEISMLYNRYSAVIVAIYVEPTTIHIRSRLQQIRRYIFFKEADHDSQRASIRAMMNLAILLCHLDQGLDDVILWASEMMNDLLDSYNTLDENSYDTQPERRQLVVTIQLLLGSIRVVIENPTLNRAAPRPPQYPDHALLREDWITRLLSFPSLSNDLCVGVEIRKLVQSFLNTRSKIIPSPSIPSLSANQMESQDEYGDAGLDMNDPAVLALLDSLEETPDKYRATDEQISEVMSELSTKRVYSLMCRHFGRDFNRRYPDAYFLEGDQWIECWCGCAGVTVRHKMRDWTFYIKMAQAASESIRHDAFCRRRVYMRFLLTMLQVDPTSYNSNEDRFLELWFETIVSSEITIEHEFSSRLFSVGALRHVVFRNFPCVPDLSTGLVSIEKDVFEEKQQLFIEMAIDNIGDSLESASPSLAKLCISFIEKMLGSLRESMEHFMSGDTSNDTRFTDLYTSIHAKVREHLRLSDSPAIQAALSYSNV